MTTLESKTTPSVIPDPFIQLGVRSGFRPGGNALALAPPLPLSLWQKPIRQELCHVMWNEMSKASWIQVAGDEMAQFGDGGNETGMSGGGGHWKWHVGGGLQLPVAGALQAGSRLRRPLTGRLPRPLHHPGSPLSLLRRSGRLHQATPAPSSRAYRQLHLTLHCLPFQLSRSRTWISGRLSIFGALAEAVNPMCAECCGGDVSRSVLLRSASMQSLANSRPRDRERRGRKRRMEA